MDPGPDLEVRHKHHTGRAWIDLVLGVCAVTISLISLLLAIGNGDAMQRLVQANSWPFVSLSVSNTDESGQKVLNLVARNKGIGPATVRTLEVFYKGAAMPDPKALVHAILGPAADGRRFPFQSSSVVGEVLSAKERVDFLTIRGPDIAPEDLGKLSAETEHIGFKICFCSVFNDCWVSDRTGTTLVAPQSVKACPKPRTPFEL